MTSVSRHGVTTWASGAWRGSAVAWLDERLAGAGIERSGAVEQPHLRPWATVLTAPTTAGPVWMKAAGPGTAFEVALYELLARTVPDHVLTPIATDPARGWMLLPVVAHPFAAMLVPLGFVQRGLGAGLDDPRFVRARDAYLDAFSDLAPRGELAETLALACRVAKIARVLTRERALQAAREQGEELDEYWATAPVETLASVLDESYLGGG